MQSSTAQRERLVSPLNLVLMAGLFASSFVFLKPNTLPGGSNAMEPSLGAAQVDELEIAYLKAQSHVGKADMRSVVDAVRVLIKTGRIEEAKQLIADHPDINVGDELRFEIDLELSAAESSESLFATLTRFVSQSQWHTEPLLKRSVELSYQIEHPELTYALYELWAKKSIETIGTDKDIYVANVYKQCGDHLAGLQDIDRAMGCYWRALDALPAQFSTFGIQVAMLRAAPAGSEEQKSIVKSLTSESTLSVDESIELADALLAIQKPEKAYRVYGELASKDAANAGRWFGLAAKWAVASNQPAHAAVYLDSSIPYLAANEIPDVQYRIELYLLASGQAKAAVERVGLRIKQNSNSAQLLERGVSLAQQSGNAKQAYVWNTELLRLDPNNEAAVDRQVDLALGANDLPMAMKWSQQHVRQAPNDKQARQRFAQVSEWSGKPHVALEQWQWLASNEQASSGAAKTSALREVVRLSSMTLRPELGAEALRELSKSEALSDDDLVRMTELYKLDGQADVASLALYDVANTHGASAFLLRTLANHEYEHSEYDSSLVAWDQYVERYGHSVESMLQRTELLWRLNRKDDAVTEAQRLQGQSLLSQATEYQLRLLAEISWQYRMPWLAAMVQPRLDSLQEQEQRIFYSKRSLDVMQEAGDDQLALQESMKLWSSTGQSDFALVAMQLALKTGDKNVLNQFAPGSKASKELVSNEHYWAQLATQRLRNKDSEGAKSAYDYALKINPEHIASIGGLLWLAISEQDADYLHELLKTHKQIAEKTPELWQAMAVGYLQVGGASTSLLWFDKLLEQIETDYGMLLTYADALEYAGRASSSRKVRQYALQQLRPVLVRGLSDDKDVLLRQYSRLSTRYESVGANEQLINYLLTDQPTAHKVANTSENSAEQVWREDLAISWLMSTQQHEHARLIMTGIHSKRLEAPAWQRLAMAMNDKDADAVRSVMQASGPLSIGNHILALRQLGQDRQAYALAQKAIVPGAWIAGSDLSDRRLAEQQYQLMRHTRPSFVTGSVRGRSLGALDVRDAGVTFRHTLAQRDVGFGFTVLNRQLSSDRHRLEGRDEVADFNVSLFYSNGTRRGRLTVGNRNTEDGDNNYASASVAVRSNNDRRELSAEIGYNESVELSSELLIAGVQNRAALAFHTDIRGREFLRLRAELTDITTRYDQEDLATGVGGSVEYGVQGSFGSNAWASSILATHVSRDRVGVLPASLDVARDSTLDSVITEEQQRLSVGATVSRGGTQSDYPQVSSPRYYVHTNVGQTWPQETLGVQVDAGAGFRVLGGDELSFSVTHDAQQSVSNIEGQTTLGVQYRYHFQ